jgi:predicted CopG family antitoxin
MSKEVIITLQEDVYEGLKTLIGERDISEFIESLIRPYVISEDLGAAYYQMAQDEEREAEALQCAEATVGDVANESR